MFTNSSWALSLFSLSYSMCTAGDPGSRVKTFIAYATYVCLNCAGQTRLRTYMIRKGNNGQFLCHSPSVTIYQATLVADKLISLSVHFFSYFFTKQLDEKP